MFYYLKSFKDFVTKWYSGQSEKPQSRKQGCQVSLPLKAQSGDLIRYMAVPKSSFFANLKEPSQRTIHVKHKPHRIILIILMKKFLDVFSSAFVQLISQGLAMRPQYLPLHDPRTHLNTL